MDVCRGVGLPSSACRRCADAWPCCTCWATALSVRMVEGHSSRWPSLPATMSWAWQEPGGVFCRTVSWNAAWSALCSSASLWWQVAPANQKGCLVCCLRTRRPP